MASASNSINIGSPSGYTYTLTASFTENSTNTTNNTSNVTCTATIKSNGASWSSSYNSTLIIYWHDNRENYDRQVASINMTSLGGNASRSASGTINVIHNNDGNLSGYAYASFTKGGTSSYTPYSSGVSTPLTALTYIPRTAIVTTAPNITDETLTFNVSFTNAGGFQVKPYMNFYEGQTASTPVVKRLERSLGSYTSPYQWTITSEEMNDLLALMPNTSSCLVTIGLDTYNNGTLIGYNSQAKTFTIVEQKPTMTTSYEDTNSTTTAITDNNQLIIRNNSTLEIGVTNATAYKQATLSSIKAELNGTIYNGTLNNGSATFNIGAINVSDNITAVVTLTDSRGFTGTQNVNIQVLDWQLPTAIISLQRENNFYSETNINVNAEYSSLDEKNTITIKVRDKKVSDTTYSSYTTLQDDVTTQLTLDNNYAWDVQVLVQDLLGSTTYNLTLDRGIPITFFDRIKRSVGINCFPANNTSLEISGKTIVDIIYPVGSIYISVNSTDPSTIFGGTWEQIKDQFLLSAGDTYTGGATGGEATHTLTINEMPSHSHNVTWQDNCPPWVQAGGYGQVTPTSTGNANKVNLGGLSIDGAGGGQAHNNMPPYIVVYVWKRTA